MRRYERSEDIPSVLASNFDVIVGPIVAVVYPAYASIRAIESRSYELCQQWLTYWVLYSLITAFELLFAKVLELFPIWPYAKLIGICWLFLPQFNGAAYVYQRFVRPFYFNPQTATMWYVPRNKNIFKPQDDIPVPKNKNVFKPQEDIPVPRNKNIFKPKEDILTAAERYMEQHGSDEFERIIRNRHRGTEFRAVPAKSHYMLFDDDYAY